MGKREPRISAYIGTAQPFARPILRHLRQVLHAVCPEAEETLNWRDHVRNGRLQAARAMLTFEGFSPSHRRGYIERIIEAKRPDTRKQRLTTAIEWMTEGKPHH